MDDLQLTGSSTADLTEIEAFNSLSIYPNPTDGVFNLDLKKNLGQSFDVSIINLSGQQVYNNHLNSSGENQTHKIDLKNLSKGVYTIQLITESGVVNRKKLIIK